MCMNVRVGMIISTMYAMRALSKLPKQPQFDQNYSIIQAAGGRFCLICSMF